MFRDSIADEMTIESSSVPSPKLTLSLIVRWSTTCHCEEDETQRIQLKMLIWQITQMLEIIQVEGSCLLYSLSAKARRVLDLLQQTKQTIKMYFIERLL